MKVARQLCDLAHDSGVLDGHHVDEDVVCGVAVERSTETLLVEMVTNETDAATKHKQTVQCTDLQGKSYTISLQLGI